MITVYNLIVGLTEDKFNKIVKSPIKNFKQLLNNNKKNSFSLEDSILKKEEFNLSNVSMKQVANPFTQNQNSQLERLERDSNNSNSSLNFNKNMPLKSSQSMGLVKDGSQKYKSSSLSFNLNLKNKPNQSSQSNIEKNEVKPQENKLPNKKMSYDINSIMNNSIQSESSKKNESILSSASGSKFTSLDKFLNNK